MNTNCRTLERNQAAGPRPRRRGGLQVGIECQCARGGILVMKRRGAKGKKMGAGEEEDEED